jgi:hypothetical protein
MLMLAAPATAQDGSAIRSSVRTAAVPASVMMGRHHGSSGNDTSSKTGSPPRHGHPSGARDAASHAAMMNRHFVLGNAVGLALVAMRGVLEAFGLLDDHAPVVTPATTPTPAGGRFALIDGTGATVTDQTFRGKWEPHPDDNDHLRIPPISPA